MASILFLYLIYLKLFRGKRALVKVKMFDISGLGDIGEQNCDVKHKQSQLIGMDSVSDICKYHLLCFMTIIEVKVMSGHQVKKVKQKNFVI